MTSLRLLLSALVCVLLPRRVKPLLLNALGHRVARGARISCSLVMVDRLYMADDARIGRFNWIRVRRLVMRPESYVGTMNFISGPFSVSLQFHAAIGNRNVVNRSEPHSGPSLLKLGTWTKITASHYVNADESILIDEYSVVAGAGSQLWTHGFIHMASGFDREEIRGKIVIGKNVYIGSQCCFNPGITIGDAVTVGAHSSIAKDLLRPGVYVSQPLRYIPSSPEERLAALQRVEDARGVHFRRKIDRDVGVQA